MNSDSKNIRQIFLDAVERFSPDQWDAYLAQACGDDAQLRHQVEMLLEAHAGDGSLLDSPAVDPAPTLDSPLTERPGTVIGPYKLLQQIGEGGFGVVYMADQKEPVKRRVALKIIKPGMDSRQVIARFEAERQALAMMDHPNIARVLDAGTTDSGRPYFVMELVKGIPITRFCDEHHLTPRERLELFVPICNAIQHAHQKGIIHRDIKPSNVLVAKYDDRPVPKVIDFGVAKATEQHLTEKTVFTQFGQILGTVDYMSPEQAELNQLDIDTRSDVYSLGVLLYELLAGETPFDRKRLRSAAFDELLKIIREEEPPRPSLRLSGSHSLPSIAANRHTEPKKLSALVRGELDWIVMKALEKDRARRYETANGFASDIQRYLNDEAVVACPPSAGYRFRKFARRNRVVLSMITVVAAVVILGIIGTTWQAIRAKRAFASEYQAHQETEFARKTESVQRKIAIQAQQKAEALAERNRRLLVSEYIANGNRLMIGDRPASGLPWLVQALKLDQGNRPAEDIHRIRFAAVSYGCPRPFQLWLHDGPVNCASFSPDGRRVVTAGYDDTARVWDLAIGEQVIPSLKHNGDVIHASFSPSGRHVVTTSRDATAQVWDADTGKPSTPPLKHNACVRHASFSPDGRYVVTAGEDNMAQVWDATSGEPAFPPLVHDGWVNHAAFSADGRRILTACGTEPDNQGGEARVWDAENGQPVTPILKHNGRVRHASFSPDGSRLVTASHGGARVWDAITGELVMPAFALEITGGAAVPGLFHASFSPSGDRLITASGYGDTARIWSASTGAPITPRLEHEDGVFRASFAPGGGRVVTASKDGTARVWDAATGQPTSLPLEHNGQVIHAAFSPDGRYILTASQDGTARVWDLARCAPPLCRSFHHQAYVTGVDFSSDGQRLVTASRDRTAQVWDVKTGEPITPALEHSNSVTGASFSPDGQRVVTTSADKTARIWDAETGQPVTPALTHTDLVTEASFSPDGQQVVTASWDGTARVWNALTGDSISPPLRHDGIVRGASFSPDGRCVVTTHRGKTTRVWHSVTGKVIATFEPASGPAHVLHTSFSPDGTRVMTAYNSGHVYVWDIAKDEPVIASLMHPRWVNCAVFSPDGRRLLTASDDNTARVWDADTGEPITAPLKHTASVNHASFNPDGQLVVTVSRDCTAQIWDAITGQPVTPPLEHRAQVECASFSPDGSRVATASRDGTARVWSLLREDRPLSDLELMAEFLSGQRVHMSGVSMPVDSNALHAAWQRLKSQYPGEFVASAEQVLAWNRQWANQSTEEKSSSEDRASNTTK